MLALSIRQPYTEEILRGLKKIEYRNSVTHKIGERFYICAARGIPEEAQLRRHSKLCKSRAALKAAGFPTGVIVGTVIISKCVPPRRKDKPGQTRHMVCTRGSCGIPRIGRR